MPYTKWMLLVTTTLISGAAHAQVSVVATTSGSGLTTRLASGATQSVPGGVIVTQGASVEVSEPYSDASATFALTTSPESSAASLSVRASVTFAHSSSAAGSVEVVYTAPRPVLVDVAMTIPPQSLSSSPCRSYYGSITVVGFGSFATGPQCPARFPAFPCTRTIPAVIDSNGLRIQMSASARTSGMGICGIGGPSGADVSVEVRPRPSGATYGAPCGATMSSTADLVTGRETVTIDGRYPVGVLLVGTQQISTPTPWGCELLTNYTLGIPLAMDPNGDATFSFVAPPPETLALQTATTDGVDVDLTNGLWF